MLEIKKYTETTLNDSKVVKMEIRSLDLLKAKELKETIEKSSSIISSYNIEIFVDVLITAKNGNTLTVVEEVNIDDIENMSADSILTNHQDLIELDVSKY